MSAEVTIFLGVAGRILANIACAHNPRLGAGLVGLSNGFLIHRAWIAQTIFDPLTLLVLATGLAFDHKMYGGFENTVTGLMACGLGVVLADFGPDLWYEFVGDELTKDMARELEALGLGPFASSYDSSSDVEIDERSDVDVGSAVSRSSRRTSRSGATSRTGTSVTVRPSSRVHAHRPPPRPAPSTITRLSRVTFDESSITQSQSDDADVDIEDLETDAGTSTQLGPTTANGDALSGSGGVDDLYMEPSTTSIASSSRAARPEPTRRPSILRRLHIPGPGQEATTSTTGLTTLRSVSATSSTSASSSHTRLTSDGETTPRAAIRPDFTPISPPSGFEPGPSFPPTVVVAPTFPEPDLSSTTSTATTSYEEYTPRIIPPSEPTPDLSTSIALPEPMHFPPLSEDPHISVLESQEQTPISPERKHEEHHESGPSFFSQIMHVPIAPPSPSHEHHDHNYQDQNGHVESPGSAMLDIPPALQAGPSPRSRSRSGSRTRSRSPAGPRPQPVPHYEPPPPPEPEPAPIRHAYGPPEYISETFEDSTVDVRELSRRDAIARIEEAWSHVERRRQRRLNIRVRNDDDDELQSSVGRNSTFHLMEDLENLRFNFKIRPGIIIITSRSRGP